MPAYYIVSGELDTKIIADSPLEACTKALKRAYYEEDIVEFGLITSSDEQGTSLKGQTKLYPTLNLLQMCGLGHLIDTDRIDNYFDNYDDLDEFDD